VDIFHVAPILAYFISERSGDLDHTWPRLNRAPATACIDENN
jgi:hypothetical protein